MSVTPNVDQIFQKLPISELQRLVFMRIDIESQKACRAVNKLWQSLVDPLLNFHVELTDNNISQVVNFGLTRQATSVSVTSFHSMYPENGVLVDTKILSIATEDSNKPIQGNVGITQLNYSKLMADFSFVETFHIESLAVMGFTSPDVLNNVHLPNVKKMIIKIFDCGFDQILPFMGNHFQTLKTITISNVAESRSDRPLMYPLIFGFIARHINSLTKVTLRYPEGIIDKDDYVQDEINHPLRSDHGMSPHLYESTKAKLKQLALLELGIDFSSLEPASGGRYDLGQTILQSQTHLKKLFLDNLQLKDLSVWQAIGDAIQVSSASLASICLGGSFRGSAALVGTPSFPCSWVKDCANLEELEMIVSGLIIENIDDLPHSIRLLNLGDMLNLTQIEKIALNLVNLETLTVPQKGYAMNAAFPRLSLYVFETILHLPKLVKLSVDTASIDKKEIMKFVNNETGILMSFNTSCIDEDRFGNLDFHLNRKKFFRDHCNLPKYMEANRWTEEERHAQREQFLEFIEDSLAARRFDVLDGIADEAEFWQDENEEGML